MKGTSCCVIRRNFKSFVHTNLLFFVLLVMRISWLIKTSGTPQLGRIDCVTSRKNVCENTKRSQANREAKTYRFITSILKGPFSVPCYFLAPDHMPRRSTDGEHFFTIFRYCIAYGTLTYSVVSTFGVLVDSTQGHKTTLLPLHGPFIWDYIRTALNSFRFLKKNKEKKRASALKQLFRWVVPVNSFTAGFFLGS